MASTGGAIVASMEDLSLVPLKGLPDDEKEPVSLLSLPNELLNIIALYLHASDKVRSLANLGLCSKRLRSLTEPLVWKEVRWKKKTWARVGTEAEQPRPFGWKFVEYIVCHWSSPSESFWNGLRNSQATKRPDLSLEVLLLSYWPNLKAVIGRTGVAVAGEGPPRNPVWIVAENALELNDKPHDHANPIRTIIRLIYGGFANPDISKDLQGIVSPVLITQHQFETGRDPKAMKRTIYGLEVPDACLADESFLRLDFHIIESRERAAKGLPGTDKSRWIWRLCCLSRAVIRIPVVMSVKCRRWIGVIQWLYMIGVNDQAFIERQSDTNLAPFRLQASLTTYLDIADFTDPMAHIQRELTRMMKGERRAGGIDERHLPSRLVVDTINDPGRPQPNCKHAEIDLRSAESSRVVRYGQCIWGRTEHRSYRDATLMTELEFDEWKEGSKATYASEDDA